MKVCRGTPNLVKIEQKISEIFHVKDFGHFPCKPEYFHTNLILENFLCESLSRGSEFG